MHGISKPIFWENQTKYFKLLSAEIYTQHAERLMKISVLNGGNRFSEIHCEEEPVSMDFV